MARSGQIEIGLSYHVVFELLQRADPAHRANRLSRARLVSQLCGLNAFPYPTDLGSGHRFSKEGLWQPRITLDDHEIEVIVSHFIQAVQLDPNATPHARRVVTKREYLRRFSEDRPERVMELADRNWPVMFGRSFVGDGTFGQYLAAAISRDEVPADVEIGGSGVAHLEPVGSGCRIHEEEQRHEENLPHLPPLVPTAIVEEAWQEVGASFERFCLTAGIATLSTHDGGGRGAALRPPL